jgi:hypothetical protein
VATAAKMRPAANIVTAKRTVDFLNTVLMSNLLFQRVNRISCNSLAF